MIDNELCHRYSIWIPGMNLERYIESIAVWSEPPSIGISLV